MAWVSPTGHSDPFNKWTNDANSYDENTGTYAYTQWIDQWIELTLGSAISCDKIRIYCSMGATGTLDCRIVVYYGEAWHEVYTGTVTPNTWVEKAIGSTESVDKAMVECNVLTDYGRLYEFDFNEVEAPPPTYIPQVIMIQYSPIVKKNGIYRRLKNLWVPQLRKLWLPTPPVCVPKGIMVQ